MKHFLQLIRFKNLLIIVFMHLLFTYFFETYYLAISLLPNVLFLTSIILITAAGYIINDIFDVEIDKINKPNKIIISKHINPKKALYIYYSFNFVGLLLGIYVSLLIGKITYSFIFIGTILLLYYYSKKIKKIAIIGNLIISFLIALNIFLIYIFDFSTINMQNNSFKLTSFLAYALIAFIFNFIREILKDIEDIKGDYNQNLKTLPILIGKKRTQTILFYLSLLLLLIIMFLISFLKNNALQIYSLVFIIIPLSYFIYKVKEIKTKKEIHKFSSILKFIMLFGLFTIIFINF